MFCSSKFQRSFGQIYCGPGWWNKSNAVRSPHQPSKVTQATSHQLQLFIPSHWFCTALTDAQFHCQGHRQKHAWDSTVTTEELLEWFLLDSALGEKGISWKASSGRSLQLPYTNIYMFNLLPRHVIHHKHTILLGKERARQEEERYHCATQAYTGLPYQFNLLALPS